MESEITDCIERNNKRRGKARIPETAIGAMWYKLTDAIV